jgi:hypothetical protein
VADTSDKWTVGDWGEVALGGPAHAECFVRADGVEDLAVALGLDGDHGAVGDVMAVQVLVLQRPERTLSHTVLRFPSDRRGFSYGSSCGREAEEVRPGVP